MFLYNLRHFWNHFKDASPDGVALHLSSVEADKIGARPRPANCPGYVLVDPDSYFWSVEETDCPRPCSILKTYPWLGGLPDSTWPPELSDEISLRNLITGCLHEQVVMGASQLILPTPLLANSGDLGSFVPWLEAGLTAAESHQLDCLAMVCVGDGALPGLSDALIDQLSATQGLSGTYVCVDTTGSAAAPITDEAAVFALLEMVYLLSEQHGQSVIVNYVDLFGLACLGVGAKGFVSGYESKARQLDFTDFSGEGGRSIPKFTSAAACVRLRPERDLIRVAARRGLLRLFEDDFTSAAEPLFSALRAGSDLLPPDWRETPNNTTAARTHLIQLLKRNAAVIAGAGTAQERASRALDWLIEAERTTVYLNERFADNALDEDGRWVAAWRRAFERICDRYSIL